MKHLTKLTMVGLFFLSASVLFGTPPDSLQLNLDSSGTMLSVKVFHPTRNTANHFIKTIDVTLNGNQIIQQNYDCQFNQEVQEAVYKLINLKAGDKIEVTGTCNIYGKKTGLYTVPKN
jgi:desulfoferrodoxin (superoxide reductase-like protein)